MICEGEHAIRLERRGHPWHESAGAVRGSAGVETQLLLSERDEHVGLEQSRDDA
jgi:hypothetical protein